MPPRKTIEVLIKFLSFASPVTSAKLHSPAMPLPAVASAASCLVRIVTHPIPIPLLKIHPADAPINLRDADNSSSAVRHRSVAEVHQDPPSPTLSIELEITSPILKPPSVSPPSRRRTGSTVSRTSITTSVSSSYSPRQRKELSKQVWRQYW
jgi:hypothetical protein